MGERLPEALRVSAFELLRQQNLLGDTGAARLAAIGRAGIGVPPADPAAGLLGGAAAPTAAPGAIDFRGADASVYVASVFGSTAGPALRAGAEPSPLRAAEVDRDFPLPPADVRELRGEQLQLETERREIEQRSARIPEQQEEDQLRRIESVRRRLLEIEERLTAYDASGPGTRTERYQQRSSPMSSGNLFRALI